MLGLSLRTLLFDHHLSDESTAIVKLGAGLMATFAALVLGLLIASAKVSFDRLNRRTGTADVDAPESLTRMVKFQQKLRELVPRNDMQRLLQSEALARSHDLAQTRWILFRPGQGAIPTPFLAVLVLVLVLVLWLGILFAGFGLVSADNRTAIATLFVCALSVSGAIFLIEDIAHPLEGMMQISRTPAQVARSRLGQ
jgi:hypothetical protein